MEFEVTHFTINKKKRYYIHLGTWNPISHKKWTPGEIWSIVLSSGSLHLPWTSTSLLSGNLAKAVGSLDIVLPFMKRSSTSSDCYSISSSESEIDDICNSKSFEDQLTTWITCGAMQGWALHPRSMACLHMQLIKLSTLEALVIFWRMTWSICTKSQRELSTVRIYR